MSAYRLKATVLVRVECQGAPGLRRVGPPMAVEVSCGLGREHSDDRLSVDEYDVRAGLERAGWHVTRPTMWSDSECDAWCQACEAATRAR